MSKMKQQQAYARGYRDSLIDHNEFLRDLERTLYALELKIEMAPGITRDEIIDGINLTRRAIDEYRDEAFAQGGYTQDSELKTRVRTIMDLQDDTNSYVDEPNDLMVLDSKVMKFISKRSTEFEN